MIPTNKLPRPDKITNKAIRDALERLDAAKAAFAHAKREAVALEQERPQAEWADAEAAERALAEGKPEPKRTHVVAHDKKLEDARHEHRVRELALKRAHSELQEALEQNASAWASEAAEAADTALAAWQKALSGLSDAYARLEETRAVARLFGPRPDVAAIVLRPDAIGGNVQVHREHGSAPGQLARISAATVLTALSELGLPREDEPVVRAKPITVRFPTLAEEMEEKAQAERRGAERRAREQAAADIA